MQVKKNYARKISNCQGNFNLHAEAINCFVYVCNNKMLLLVPSFPFSFFFRETKHPLNIS